MGRGKKQRGRGEQGETDWSTERTLADVEAEAAEAAALAGGGDAAGEADSYEAEPFDASPFDATPHDAAPYDASPQDASPGAAGARPAASPGAAAFPVASKPAAKSAAPATARCACGSEEFLLEAYIAVVRGKPQPEPVEMESMTCPQCGREYEAVWLSDGTIARGEYRGQTDLDE